jgi:hypothetical protein
MNEGQVLGLPIFKIFRRSGSPRNGQSKGVRREDYAHILRFTYWPAEGVTPTTA